MADRAKEQLTMSGLMLTRCDAVASEEIFRTMFGSYYTVMGQINLLLVETRDSRPFGKHYHTITADI